MIDEYTGKKIVSPLDFPADFDYRVAYKELRDVFDSSLITKALIYAAKNPVQVYGQGTEECNEVLNGYFDLYLSNAFIPSSCERT